MVKVELEYHLKTSPSLLFARLSSASGLEEWFADHVRVEGKKFTFVWNKADYHAELVALRPNEYVRFKWIDNDLSDEFEFRITLDDITGDLALVVIDTVEESEKDDIANLWDNAVARLREVTGS